MSLSQYDWYIMMYEKTGDENYKKLADNIRKPETKDLTSFLQEPTND